jgi:uncharacterized membrane protein
VTASAERPVPSWRRDNRGESLWPLRFTLVVAIVLQVVLPEDFALHPRWGVLAVEVVLLVVLSIVHAAVFDGRLSGYSRRVRVATILMVAVITLANTVSAGRLVVGLVNGTLVQDAGELLVTGAAIWATNVIVFALWYWELDRGGPGRRADGTGDLPPDFVFPQMTDPELAPVDWFPHFTDYLYLSFTNAAAFSPTDVMPYARWAKLVMMAQTAVSLATIALVVARAVNILR